MTNRSAIADTARAYIIDSFLTAAQARTFHDDDDLLQLLDSLQLLRMVMALESTFSIKVQDSELNAENLGSVRRIAAFVARKRQEPPADPPGSARPGA